MEPINTWRHANIAITVYFWNKLIKWMCQKDHIRVISHHRITTTVPACRKSWLERFKRLISKKERKMIWKHKITYTKNASIYQNSLKEDIL